MINKIKKSKSNNFYIITLFILSTVIFISGNPNFIYKNGIGFAGAFVYLFPLFLIKRLTVKSSWKIGFLYGCSAYGFSYYWIYNSGIIFFILFEVYIGFLYSILFLILKITGKKHLKNGWLFQWILICGFEYIKTKGFAGINAGLPGYMFWRYKYLNQICDVIGIYGFTFFIIGPSILIYALIGKIIDKKNIKINRDIDNNLYECTTHINYISKYEIQLKSTNLLLPIFFVLVWSFGLYEIINYSIKCNYNYENCSIIKIASIQHNESGNTKDIKKIRDNSIQLMSLSDDAIEMNPDVELIIWPELAIRSDNFYILENDELVDEKFNNSIKDYFLSHNKSFLIGNTGLSYNEPNGNYNNAIYLKKSDKLGPEIYSKNILVPVKEYIPLFADKFSLDEKFESFDAGKEIKIFNANDFYFSTPISDEAGFSQYCRQMVMKGSRCFINLCNDKPYNSRSQQYQNISMAVFRSIENRIPFIRTSNSGLSCVINCNGIIEKQAQDFCKTYLYAEVPVINNFYKQTFYNKHGDIAGPVVFIFGIVLLIIQIIIDIILKTKNKSQVE